VQAIGEDVNLVLLDDIGVTCVECQELGLIFGNCRLSLELDQLPERVVAQWWPKPLVHQSIELSPR
jgi:hypothetical protein